MWNDFTDFELAELAGCYNIEDELEFRNDLTLANRDQIEKLLTLVEHNMAFEE
jgi:hypothetical protein